MAHVCGTVLVTFCCDKISWPKATCKRGIYFGLTVLEKESIRSEEGWQQGAGGGSSEITSSTEDTKQGGPLEPGRPVRSEPPPVMDLFSKATPPKGSITFPKEHHQLRTRCSNACTYRGYFSFKPPPPPPPRHGWHPGLDIWGRGKPPENLPSPHFPICPDTRKPPLPLLGVAPASVLHHDDGPDPLKP